GCGKPGCDPSCNCERWLEVWNLVFIEFNRDEKGNLNPLPSKNIDTGMGLERISRLLQGVETNFDTDLFAPIIAKLPGDNVLSKRIVADHARAATYLIADGVMPGNEGRSYVLRRIIRRAALHLKKLGVKDIFLPQLAGTVIDLGKSFYPELSAKAKQIGEALRNEESCFNATLEAGMKMLDDLIARNGKTVPGAEAFKLHDTYGFPIEMTREIAAEKGAQIDLDGFNRAMEEQKTRARSASGTADITTRMDLSKYPKTNFIGYDKLECDTRVIGIFPNEKVVILEKTPFYPEGGGQVGDTGIIFFDGKEIMVTNTFGEIGGVILHKVDRVEGLKDKQGVKVKIDASRRASTSANHTATHLLHAALRCILGPQATQAGSFVGPDRLRFDFHAPSALNLAQIEEIERIVNENIKKKIKVEWQETSLEEAKKAGVTALFGEKYGNKVRIVKVTGVSAELCGGCHVRSTSDIVFFKIIKEESLQAGVRRIEAVSGPWAKVHTVYQAKAMREEILKLQHRHRTLQEEKSRLGDQKLLEPNVFSVDQEELVRLQDAVDKTDIVNVNKFLEHLKGRVDWLKERNLSLEKEIEKLKGKKVLTMADSLANEACDIKGIKVLMKELPDVSMPNLRSLADEIKAKLPSVLLVLASTAPEKVSFLVNVTDDLTGRINAGKIAKLLAETCGGGGGGKADKAEAGGKAPSRVSEAFKRVADSL
ncbi:MAG TPA: alanine--tRNA ligase, partial [Candidatus Omnitrophota bacterium]|nr:alanine--tRNA ligase [Candidatus Omnitrophota bacterium]